MTNLCIDFWQKVAACEHKNLSPNYAGDPGCSMASLGGYSWENHCLDCGVYIASCGCGCVDGMSGWPAKRWKKRFGEIK